jgi:hypothetical protein
VTTRVDRCPACQRLISRRVFAFGSEPVCRAQTDRDTDKAECLRFAQALMADLWATICVRPFDVAEDGET